MNDLAKKVRKDFPILAKKVNGHRFVYLDNAATTERPKQVVKAMDEYYLEYNANVHRGIYRHSEEATEAHENARANAAGFIGGTAEELVFTRGTTEAINLVSYSWGEENIKRGDKIVISVMEHHSNLVPWQQLAIRKGAKLEFMDIGADYEIAEKEYSKIRGAKLVAICDVSNVLGTINGVERICKIARESGAVTLVDGAQSVPHMETDVKKIGCDFFAFSGHKMLGPTGIGGLYGRKEMLEGMKPFNYGGDMIREVYPDRSVWNDLPYKFEAGTPNVAGAIGLGAAVDYLKKIGMDEVRKHEIGIMKYALEKLGANRALDIYGTKNLQKRGAVIPFNVKGIHPHDLGTLLDEYGVAIRTGHHCAMPLHIRLQLDATNRASFYLYNSKEDVDALADAVVNAQKVFSKAGG